MRVRVRGKVKSNRAEGTFNEDGFYKTVVTPSTPHIYVLIIKEIKKLNLIQVFKTYLNTSLSSG